MTSNAICTWDFTAPCDKYSFDDIKSMLVEHCKKWAFQKEQGDNTGYIHWQGRCSLKIKSRTPYKIFNTTDVHYTPTSTENSLNTFYVIKSLTRIDGPWTDSDPEPKYIPRQIKGITLRKWQQQIIDDRLIWDTRTINIVWDDKGNHGKSILKTYAGVYDYGRALPFTNDYRDMMRMVMDTPKMSLYIIDIPRALKKDQLRQFFGAVETIKDGYAYDDRYHFKEEYFDCPNIWIFTNILPETEMLSKDRWKIWTFNSLGLLTEVKKAVCDL